jgi:tryptophan halogenase
VVESPDIPTVGVGEATIPPIIDFLRFLGIDVNDFIAHTQATFKLAIRFRDWLRQGHGYWHPFGNFGATIDRRRFFHFFHKARALGLPVQVNQFSLEIAMAEANKFVFPDNALGIAQDLRYALHFDAGLVARYLRSYAEHSGVVRIEKNVTGVVQREDGFIDAVTLADGTRLEADLFIDCTGFRGLLIEGALKSGYNDWSRYLPVDRAVALPTPLNGPRTPYTLSTARTAGWQWRIQLQHRIGNGYVYSSSHISDDAALQDLLTMVKTQPLAEPRVLRFVTGHRKQFWNRNVVALGLASGFLEPLESTSIHLIASGIYALLDHFPDRSFDPVNIANYNAVLTEEFERVRDFIILHYCATQRDDAELWRYCRHMELPDSLRERIDLYRRTGRIFQKRYELFVELSWFFVMHGMGIEPQSYDPLVDVADFDQVKRIMSELRHKVLADVAAAPSHDSFFPAALAPEEKGTDLFSGKRALGMTGG